MAGEGAILDARSSIDLLGQSLSKNVQQTVQHFVQHGLLQVRKPFEFLAKFLGSMLSERAIDALRERSFGRNLTREIF
jgi:hypothetical protein